MTTMEKAKRIFGGAISWSYLCKLIDDNFNKNTALMVTYPVCKSFLCELLLKSIIAYEGHFVCKKHNLYSLFKLINQQTQNIIINSVCEILLKSNRIYDKNKFLFSLKTNKDNFEKWRYFYENNQIADLDFTNAFHTALANYANNVLGNNTPNKNN